MLKQKEEISYGSSARGYDWEFRVEKMKIDNVTLFEEDYKCSKFI